MTAERQPPAKLYRFAISILLIGHLLAVILPPLSFQAGQSPSVATLFAPLEGYSQFLYIDRGYAFFAPDPGPSRLIQAAITERNGQRVEKMFPDREDQWPRLLYHRHFMLAEYLQEIYQPPGPPPGLAQVDRQEAEFWVRTRARYEHVRNSAVEHLKHKYPGRDVVIRRLEHLVPDFIEFQADPIELTDPRLYRVLLDQPIEIDEAGNLAAPSGPPETIPPPSGAAVARDSDAATSSEGVVESESKDDVDEKAARPLSDDPDERPPNQDQATDDQASQEQPAEKPAGEPSSGAQKPSDNKPTDNKPADGEPADVSSEVTDQAAEAAAADSLGASS